jgi:hypothetical protein
MSSRYDDWLATTPEADAADERERRRNGAAERRADAAEEPPLPVGARRVFGGLVWCPISKRAVPDKVGRIVYPEDYMYDPLSRRGFE